MADPNRKINLDLPSDESSSDGFEASEISLVKEFEEEFKDRFTEEDAFFTEFCKQKPKPPIIVFPFEASFNHRGGGHRGGRFQNQGHRQNFDNRRNNYDGQRYNNHNYNRNNRDYQQRDEHRQPPYKRARDEHHGGS